MSRDNGAAGRPRRDPFAVLGDRVPPQNMEAEEGSLGSMLLDPDQIPEVRGAVEAGDYYRDAHAELFALVCEMYDARTPVDTVTVADELARRGRYKALGGDEFLERLCGSVPHAANAVYYAKIVRQKSVSRRVLEAGAEIVEAVLSNAHTADDLVALLDRRAASLSESVTPESEPLRAAVGRVLGRLQQGAGAPGGIETGLPDLDSTLGGGLRPGRLYTVAARPSMGKSALVQGFAENAAKHGRAVLYATLEMTADEVAERALAMHCGVPSGALARPGLLTPADNRAILDRGGDVMGWRWLVNDSAGLTVPRLSAEARRLRRRNALDLLVVDYIQLLTPDDPRDGRQEQIAKMSRALKNLSRDADVPVVCVSQLNRDLERREDRRPRMADLRESGAIEQDSDVVILLHRPEYYRKDDRPGEADLIVAKQRNGPTAVHVLTWRGSTYRYESGPPAPDGGWSGDPGGGREPFDPGPAY